MGDHRLWRRHRSEERTGLSEGQRFGARAVMRRDRARAETMRGARRRARMSAPTTLIADPEVDAVYIATPPSTIASLRSGRGGGQALPRRKTDGAHPRRMSADGRRIPRARRPACGWRTTAGRCRGFCACGPAAERRHRPRHLGAYPGDRAARDRRPPSGGSIPRTPAAACSSTSPPTAST